MDFIDGPQHNQSQILPANEKLAGHSRGISNATEAIVAQSKKPEKTNTPSGFADSVIMTAAANEEGKATPHKDGSNSGPRSGGSVISSAPPPVSNRKDPNEEFFMMTFLSYKLNH